MSRLIQNGFTEWRACRDEYDLTLYSQYERAAAACNDRLVNEAGRARGIDPISLFMGPAVRAHKWASDELLEHWLRHPRVTFADFERQWSQRRDLEAYAS